MQSQNELGVLVVELASGAVVVQVYKNVHDAETKFAGWHKGLGVEQQEVRATLIGLDFAGQKCSVQTKTLPEPMPVDLKHDGWRLGEGPIPLPDAK